MFHNIYLWDSVQQNCPSGVIILSLQKLFTPLFSMETDFDAVDIFAAVHELQVQQPVWLETCMLSFTKDIHVAV